jgi:hypothetical protein
MKETPRKEGETELNARANEILTREYPFGLVLVGLFLGLLVYVLWACKEGKAHANATFERAMERAQVAE